VSCIYHLLELLIFAVLFFVYFMFLLKIPQRCKRLFASYSRRKPSSDSRPFALVEKFEMGQFFLQILQFFPVIIPVMLNSHSFIYHRRCTIIKTYRYALFWDVTQRRVVIRYRRFDTTYGSHVQGSSSLRRKIYIKIKYIK
jgi:hypothetical protein